MKGIFSISGLSVPGTSTRTDSSAAAKVSDLQHRMRILEDNLAKALMINESLWEIMKSQHKLTEDDLNEMLYMIDMRDGQLDGKNQRSAAVSCPNCQRSISPRHAACIYCGEIIDDSVFRIT